MFTIRFRRIDGHSLGNNGLPQKGIGSNFAKLRAADMLYTKKADDNSLSYTKDEVMDAIEGGDLDTMREISTYFFGLSGLYSRLLYHLATLFTYDNVITPVTLDQGMTPEKQLKAFNSSIIYKRRFNIKKNFPAIGLKVLRDGVYYGYLREGDSAHVFQTLPIAYCRSYYEYAGKPVVDFNVRYFDDAFRTDATLKANVLKSFPKEVRNAYNKYKAGTLEVETTGAWIQLDPDYATVFRMNETERPFFISVIPDIIDLANRKDSEDQKDLQELYKMLVQKMPIKKDGELVFDIDEAGEMHQNAIAMTENAPGIDVLTTFADVDVLNLQDKNRITSDNLTKAYASVYSEAGTSKMVFATDGNLSLKDSLVNDEAIMEILVETFQRWFESRLNTLFARNPKKMFLAFQILPVTRHNRADKIGEYQEQITYGYPKSLVSIAGGLPQEVFMGLNAFETHVLHVQKDMIPAQSSHTQSDDDGGNPGLDDNEKEQKTLDNEANKETGGKTTNED